MSKEIKAVTHTEKVIAGEVDAVTHLEKVIAKYSGGGGGGGGFTPTQAQLDAMNSGITAERLETDENNILLKANIDDLNSRVIPTKNLINPDTLTDGYLSSYVGQITESTTYKTTDYIPIANGQSITISPKIRFFLAFNSSKQGIQASYVTSEQNNYTYTAATDGYVRFTFNKNTLSSEQAEYGSTVHSYEKYGYTLSENIYFSENQKNDIINTVENNYFTDEVNLIDPTNLTAGYLSSWAGGITESTTYYTSDFIPVKNGQSITISPGIRFFLAYNSEKVGIQASYVNTRIDSAYTYTATENGYIRVTFFKSNINAEQAEYGSIATGYIPYGEKRLTTGYHINQEDDAAINANIANQVFNSHILSGKMWYPCGDSFTEGDFTGLQESDYIFNNGEKYAGRKKVYPYYIGNRTNMKVSNMAVSGMSLAQYSGSTAGSCFTYPDGKYTQIPVDADYITLYFGINDSHGNIPIGTADDVTNETFCGAWNVVFDWIYTNRPNAKVGVIISNGCDTTEYPTATIAMCKKWGIAYLDINGDETLPAVIRTNMRTGLDSAVKQRILEKYRCTGTNWHPNAKAHEDESFMIQQFLERL